MKLFIDYPRGKPQEIIDTEIIQIYLEYPASSYGMRSPNSI